MNLKIGMEIILADGRRGHITRLQGTRCQIRLQYSTLTGDIMDLNPRPYQLEESQEQLWTNVLEEFIGSKPAGVYENIISKLKKLYLITRKP